MGLSEVVLTEAQRAAGLDLTEDGHNVFLWRRVAGSWWHLLAVFSSSGAAAKAIRAEADRALAEST